MDNAVQAIALQAQEQRVQGLQARLQNSARMNGSFSGQPVLKPRRKKTARP